MFNTSLKAMSCGLLLIVSGSLLADNQWIFSSNDQGDKSASFEKKSTILKKESVTQLAFNLTKDAPALHANGTSSITFCISPIKDINAFNFDDFEGPGAPAGSKKLMKVAITKGSKELAKYSLQVAGWRSAEVNDGFCFAHSDLIKNKKSSVRKILNVLAKGADNIDITILDYKNRSINLSTSFPVANDKENFSTLLKGF